MKVSFHSLLQVDKKENHKNEFQEKFPITNSSYTAGFVIILNLLGNRLTRADYHMFNRNETPANLFLDAYLQCPTSWYLTHYGTGWWT